MRYQWTPEADALLGTESDMSVATRLGISHMAVLTRRNKLNISALNQKIVTAKWTQAMDDEIGKGTDADVAKKLGLSEGQVMTRRRKLNIARVTPSDTNRRVTGVKVFVHSGLYEKICKLEPFFIERFLARGLPVQKLEAWQIIECAIDLTEKTLSKNK